MEGSIRRALQDAGRLRTVLGKRSRALGKAGRGLHYGHTPAIQVHRARGKCQCEAPIPKARRYQRGRKESRRDELAERATALDTLAEKRSGARRVPIN